MRKRMKLWSQNPLGIFKCRLRLLLNYLRGLRKVVGEIRLTQERVLSYNHAKAAVPAKTLTEWRLLVSQGETCSTAWCVHELWRSNHNCCNLITNESQQNAQMIYIFSIRSTYMFRSCLTIIRVRCYRVSNTVMCAFVPGVIVHKYILHNPNTVACW
jgi:hypothetical protein